MSRFLTASVFIAVLASGVTYAQLPREAGAALASPTGSAAITGVVQTDASPAQPLRRVIVTLAGAALPTSLSAITDDAGRFAFEALPTGRFTVEAVKAAYLPMAFGAPHSGRPGAPISLSAGAREAITIHLSRGAVITGTIQDDRGKPAVGAEVQVVDTEAPSNALPGTVRTDDRGMYRFYGLPGGTYWVAALPRQLGRGEIGERSTAEIDAILASLRQGSGHPAPLPAAAPSPVTGPLSAGRTMNLAPVYFPGTPTFSAATSITVRSGEERTGIDFPISPIATSEISGVISDTAGPLGDLQVMLTGDDGGPRLHATTPETVGGGPTLSVGPGRDGRFTFMNVAPGHYILTARSRVGVTRLPETNAVRITPTSPPRVAGEEWRYAQSSVTVNGSDVSGVSLALGPGGVLSGRIVPDASPGAPLPDLTKLRVDLTVPSAVPVFITGGSGVIGGNLPAPPEVTPGADGRFEVTGIAPNAYQLRVLVPAAAGAWWPRSAMAGDRDLLDAPMSIALGQNLADVVVALRNRHTELTGTLQDPTGGPTSEFVIMVFPADRSLWISGSRRIQLAQPATDGVFSIKDLPPGDYLVAALTDVDATALYEPSYLQEVAKQSMPVTIRDGGRTVQNLRIAR